MKKDKFVLLFLLLSLIIWDCVEANVIVNGGRGLTNVRAAWVMDAGRLTLYSHTRFWGQVAQIKSTSNLTEATTVWNVQGLTSIRYGLGGHFEIGIAPIVYQDVNKGSAKNNSGYVVPSDLFLTLKIGSFGKKANSLSYGVETFMRLGTSKSFNVLYEPYSAGSTEIGFTTLMSYAADPLYPDDALSAHLNLGYLNHNDVGRKLAGENQQGVLRQTQELLYGLGLKYPTQGFDYALELYGNIFLQQPPNSAFSRENFLYLTPSVTYKAYRWLDLIVAGDFRLSKDEAGSGASGLETIGLPANYTDWRINLGMRLAILPTSVYRITDRDVLMQKADNRRELFEQIIQERRETESAEEELTRIKEERKKAEKQLERLRKILEGQAKRREASEELQKEYQNPSTDDKDKK